MLFRFLAALVLVTAVALTSVAIQKRNLALKRDISQQQYELERLREDEARLRLEVQRLESPQRLHQIQQANRGAVTE
ncbi:MAG: hypothetical protein R3C18_17395 [Planctomycetaceae bacterium]